MNNSDLNSQADGQRNYNRNYNNEENIQDNSKNVFTKVCDIILYPFKQVLQATRIRMDAHIYIEFQAPCVHISVKFCIITMWIILYMIHNRN